MKNLEKKYKIIDISYLPQPQRNLRLMEAMLCLRPGCSFLIKLDKAPMSLMGHLETELHNKFQWRMFQSGPEAWLIQVTRNPIERVA